MTERSETFRRHWPVSWRIDAAEAARAEGADRVAYVPGPSGGDAHAFDRWAGWAEITICADPVFGAARSLATMLGLDPVESRGFAAGQGLLGLGIERIYLRPDEPTPDDAIDVDRIADLFPV